MWMAGYNKTTPSKVWRCKNNEGTFQLQSVVREASTLSGSTFYERKLQHFLVPFLLWIISNDTKKVS